MSIEVTRLSRGVPSVIASAVFLFGVWRIASLSIAANDGHFVHPLDDPYIHMAMAKNLVENGVYAPGSGTFAAASSSPLWTFLLAGSFAVAGAREWLPLAWNLLFGVLAIAVASSIARRLGLGAIASSVACLALVYLTPMIPVAFAGLEHMAHLFSVLLLLRIAIDSLEGERAQSGLALAAAAALAVSFRYESLFLVVLLAVVFVVTRKTRLAFVILGAALVPVCIFGLWSLAHGGWFLPNSLMLKGKFPEARGTRRLMRTLFLRGVQDLDLYAHLMSLLAAMAFTALLSRVSRKVLLPLALLIAGGVYLQLQFAAIGFFYRYEAYLLGAGTLFAFCASALFLKRQWALPARNPVLLATAMLSAVALIPIFWSVHVRATFALETCVPASLSIYRQQYQMARFVRDELGPHPRIAANDIGCLAFYTDAHVLDAFGLGSNAVTGLRRERRYSPATLDSLLRAGRITTVMVYRSWFTDAWANGGTELPATLHTAGTMRIADNHGCADSTVEFLGTTPAAADTIAKALAHFRASAPTGVSIRVP
ncbi:MAG: glycosyltransferase family 39 protein [Ignavibacteria bacterium]|nr:glycosyltransferase family 39 protein [Ignavibacteria bacterium]